MVVTVVLHVYKRAPLYFPSVSQSQLDEDETLQTAVGVVCGVDLLLLVLWLVWFVRAACVTGGTTTAVPPAGMLRPLHR